MGGDLAVLAVKPAIGQSASSPANPSRDSDLSALVSRQQLRMDLLEGGIKDLRGTLEVELREIKTQLESLAGASVANQSGSSIDIKVVKGELVKLNDSLDILNQRVTRTFGLFSDVEFRVLRLEKRLNTLLSLSGEDITKKLAQQGTTGTGANPEITLGRDPATGETIWTIDQQSLDGQSGSEPSIAGGDLAGDGSANIGADSALGADPALPANTSVVASHETPQNPGAQNPGAQNSDTPDSGTPNSGTPSILPDTSPEEQFRFALMRALKNDLELAEQAFTEFNRLYPVHERSSDALFWLGRVQFIQEQYEKSASTFSKFNEMYSNDPRLPDTTLWIAESVSNFATPEQACLIYENLAQFLDNPPENFQKKLKELSDNDNCST